MLNDTLCYANLWVLACMIVVVFAWQSSGRLSAHLRRLASFTDHRQTYHRIPNFHVAWLKRHLLDAPLLRSRHNQEWQLSRAVNMGTLPSRFHTLLLTVIVVMNVVLCTNTVPYGSKESTVAELIRNRTGYMATANLFPLLVMAGRNNPLIPLLRVSFDTWNLLHRWLGRIVVLEGLAHVIAWGVPKVQTCRSFSAFRVMGANLSRWLVDRTRHLEETLHVQWSHGTTPHIEHGYQQLMRRTTGNSGDALHPCSITFPHPTCLL